MLLVGLKKKEKSFASKSCSCSTGAGSLKTDGFDDVVCRSENCRNIVVAASLNEKSDNQIIFSDDSSTVKKSSRTNHDHNENNNNSHRSHIGSPGSTEHIIKDSSLHTDPSTATCSSPFSSLTLRPNNSKSSFLPAGSTHTHTSRGSTCGSVNRGNLMKTTSSSSLQKQSQHSIQSLSSISTTAEKHRSTPTKLHHRFPMQRKKEHEQHQSQALPSMETLKQPSFGNKNGLSEEEFITPFTTPILPTLPQLQETRETDAITKKSINLFAAVIAFREMKRQRQKKSCENVAIVDSFVSPNFEETNRNHVKMSHDGVKDKIQLDINSETIEASIGTTRMVQRQSSASSFASRTTNKQRKQYQMRIASSNTNQTEINRNKPITRETSVGSINQKKTNSINKPIILPISGVVDRDHSSTSTITRIRARRDALEKLFKRQVSYSNIKTKDDESNKSSLQRLFSSFRQENYHQQQEEVEDLCCTGVSASGFDNNQHHRHKAVVSTTNNKTKGQPTQNQVVEVRSQDDLEVSMATKNINNSTNVMTGLQHCNNLLSTSSSSKSLTLSEIRNNSNIAVPATSNNRSMNDPSEHISKIRKQQPQLSQSDISISFSNEDIVIESTVVDGNAEGSFYTPVTFCNRSKSSSFKRKNSKNKSMNDPKVSIPTYVITNKSNNSSHTSPKNNLVPSQNNVDEGHITNEVVVDYNNFDDVSTYITMSGVTTIMEREFARTSSFSTSSRSKTTYVVPPSIHSMLEEDSYEHTIDNDKNGMSCTASTTKSIDNMSNKVSLSSANKNIQLGCDHDDDVPPPEIVLYVPPGYTGPPSAEIVFDDEGIINNNNSSTSYQSSDTSNYKRRQNNIPNNNIDDIVFVPTDEDEDIGDENFDIEDDIDPIHKRIPLEPIEEDNVETNSSSSESAPDEDITMSNDCTILLNESRADTMVVGNLLSPTNVIEVGMLFQKKQKQVVVPIRGSTTPTLLFDVKENN